MAPAGTSNELGVQNEWEENTHTHTLELKHIYPSFVPSSQDVMDVVHVMHVMHMYVCM